MKKKALYVCMLFSIYKPLVSHRKKMPHRKYQKLLTRSKHVKSAGVQHGASVRRNSVYNQNYYNKNKQNIVVQRKVRKAKRKFEKMVEDTLLSEIREKDKVIESLQEELDYSYEK